MSYRFREEDFPPLQRGDPSTSSPPDQEHWQATPQTLPPRRAQHQQGPVHTPRTQRNDQGHWQATPQTLPPRRTQHQQRPVHTPHTQRKDQVSSSSAAGKPRKMVLERQELQAKATKAFHLLSKSELRKSNLSVGPLSRDNYKDTFHHLLYWEEHEHEVALRDRCSGSYCVCLNSETGIFPSQWLYEKVKTFNMCLAEIWGMSEDQCDYAKQAATDAKLRLRSTTIKCQIQHAGLSGDGEPILFVSLPDGPPAELRGTSFPWNPNAEVRFVLKHSYFQNLHRAVECLSDATLAKLLPQPKDLKEYWEYTQRVRMRRPELPQFRLDYDFQFNTMKNILYSAPSAPFLVTGPFGTGKTRMLATAAYMFLMGDSAPQPVTRILLATHHSQTADSYLDNYFGPAAKKGNMQGVEILRLVPNDRIYRYNGSYKDCIKSISSVKHRLEQYQLVISTLLTAPHLVTQGGCYPGYFSHILVDEAAQAREPELTAALSLAAENTKLVFAGDHLQVGPETLVLGEEALKNGLGQSLLKRLHTLYQSKEYSMGAEMYTASLLSNWRSHREIVKLVSKLFYRDTLQSCSHAKLPPNTTYPLHFICTSTAQGQECILADEANLKEEGEKEAAAVLEAVQKYCIPWPRMEWGSEDMNSICIIAPSRMQQRIIRRNLKRFGIPREVNTEVAFDIQGREYRAVFLCTSEPVLKDGSTANPTKSICDKFVFNTVITRAQSLVVAVGNPYRLFDIEEKNPNGAGCWKEYVTQCLKKYTVKGSNLKNLQKVLHTSPDVPEEEAEDPILDSYSEIRAHLPLKMHKFNDKPPARAQGPGHTFSKTGSVSSMLRKSTNFEPADRKVKEVAHPHPTRATPSASVALFHPTVTQPLTSSGQRISSGNQYRTVAASAMALPSHDAVKPSPRSKTDLCKDPSTQCTHMLGVHHVTMQQSTTAKGAVAQALPQSNVQEVAVGSVSSMQCKSTNFGPADYKVKKVARPPPTRATPSASVALPNPTVTQPWTSSGQRISSGNQHKTMATSAMALLSHDAVKSSPRSKSDLCKDPSMQHTHMPGVHHVTMQQSTAAYGAVAQALSQINGQEAAVTSDDDFPLLTKSQLERKDHLLSKELSRDNYKEKFHHLLYWEEHEHEIVLKDRCNGIYDVELFSGDLSHISRKLQNYDLSRVIQILGMTVDQCEYAMQAATEGRVFLNCSTSTGYIGGMGIAKDGQPVLYLALNEFLQELKISPRVPHVQVEFLLKHSYFQNLHRAVNWLPDAGVKKLLPEVNDLEVYVKQQKCKKLQMENFALDYEYQFDALLKILSATPKAPFIVSGPFGTGKTKLLATAALRFLQGEGCSSVARPRILLAAHHLQTADSYLDLYFGPAKRSKQMRGVRLVRLVVNSSVYQYRGQYPGFVKAAIREKERLGDYQLIITTLLTALQLKWHCQSMQPGFFSHILVDEAAQAREPELTAVLSLADEHTKVVLGGDHLQVGPRTLVLGKAAKENGLGVSVLERLHCLYHTPEYLQNAEAYSASLLTNYRCHPGILRLPSHLFYDATLQCRSTSKLHPKTHQPLHFICTSLKQGESCVLAKEADLIDEGKREAEAVLDAVKKYCTEYPKEWGSDLRDMPFLESICIVTPWRKQQKQVLDLLRSAKYRQLKGVDHTVAYDIQGRQYRAVFLCTSEPVLADGSTANPTKSICDKSVFNTVITRAQSLVVAVGNPFRLFHIEEKCAKKVACWKEYVRNCMQCQSLDVIAERDRSALSSLQEVVFESLSKQLKARELVVDSGDSILEAYNAELSKKSHNEKAKIALRSFGGDRGWTVWTEENPQKKEIKDSPKKINSEGLLCRLEQKTYRKCIAQPLDPTLKEIILQGVNNRRCAFDQATVKVQTLHEGSSGEQYGRVTDVVEQGEAKQFVCRVDQYNAIFFFPVDGKSPKIVNLPQLSRTLMRLECPDDFSRDQLESGRHDVMCFNPESVKQGKVPKVQESIPLDIAVHLLFVVWPINWDKEHRWPLGVVVGAIPKGETFFHAERLLRVQYHIDDPDPNFDGIPAEDSSRSTSNLPTVGHPHWEGAITIDPEGAINLDDALTLTEVEITEDGSTLLEYGVHIANVGRYLPRRSELDERILEKCTSVYGRCQGEFKFQPMLPKEFSSKLSLDPVSARFCISVTSKVTRSIDGNLQLLEESVGVQISEDTVRSMLKITYKEAEILLRISDGYSIEEDSLPTRVKEYNQIAAEQNQLTCQERLNLLGRIAQSLHSKRLGQAGIACPLSDYDTERHPQAHFLVSELMIWANACVAKKLLESHLPTVLLRVQPPPNQQKRETILEEFSSVIASTSLFPGLQPYEKEVHMTCPYIMLTDVKDELVSYLTDGKLQLAQNLLCSVRRHPQLAVLEAHCARAQNRAQYKLLKPHHNEDESSAELVSVKHHTLNTEYTHFTSPLRRAADVVVQRMLLKVLDGFDSTLEDSVEELKNAVQKFNLMSANARRYEDGLSVLDTAMYASRSSICTTAYISSVASGNVELIYADHALSNISPRNRTIKESILIPPSYDGHSGPEQCIWKVRMASLQCSPPINFTAYESKDLSKPRESAQLQVNEEGRITLFVPSDEKEVAFNSCSVVAKHKKTAILISPSSWENVQKFICDTGSVTAAQVLSALSDEATNGDVLNSVLTTDEEEDTCSNATSTLQEKIEMEEEEVVLKDKDEEVVKNEEEEVVEEEEEEEEEKEEEEGVDEGASISAWNDACCSQSNSGGALVSDLDQCKVADESIFCILEVPISLNVFKDYKIWLTCSSREHILTVKVQLMEMAPHLHICVQHRTNPEACFTDVTPKQASKPEYNSIEEYCELWINTYLAECAASSTDDSKKNGKMIIVQNVPLHWPKLEVPANVYGEPYCHPKGVISFLIPKDFVAELSDFFEVEPGCLVCVRYEIQLGQRERGLLKDIYKKRFGDLKEGEDHVKRLLGNFSDGYVRAVYHMVVRKVVKVASKSKDDSSNSETVPLRVTLTMKGESKVSQVMAALLSSQQYTCDMELCALTTPSKRVFRSLVELEDICKSDHKAVESILLKSIVLGDIPTLQNLHGFPPRIVDEFLANNHAVTHLWDGAAHDLRGGACQGKKNATPLNGKQVEAIKRSLVNRFQLIQGPPGTGKSVTGAHLAFAFALLNKAERKPQLTKKPCVLYCGPSNKSVEVVLRLLKPMSDKVNILSIYGNMIEQLDYPAPLTGSMGPNAKQDHQCPDDLQEFALHHKVHRLSSHRGAILNLESTLRRLHDRGSIPKAELRRCYWNTIAEAEKEIICKGEFDIVLCTCSEAASRRVNNTLAPVQCIIDEAAMAMEPECLAAISKAYHVVLIGDHKQLQPVIDNRKAKENGLGISLFERYARLGTDASTPTLPFITLQVQYRMQLAVCWFPSEHFYGKMLRPHKSVARATAPGLETFWPNAKWPIVFCDVDGHEDGNTGTQKSGKDSKSNKKEAAQVVKIVDVLLKKYSVCPEDVAVLTPYTAQKKLLERELTNEIKVKVRTVTESQGSEFKIVILSTVRSQPAKDIENEEVVQADRHWMLENLGFITDEHQICVGITRSRLGLVIVGNACLLQYNDTWKRLVEHYKKNNCLVKGKDFPKLPSRGGLQ